MDKAADDRGAVSTTAAELENHICNVNVPKSEAEWWACHEIERLRGDLAVAGPDPPELKRLIEALENAAFVCGGYPAKPSDKKCDRARVALYAALGIV